MAMVTARVLLVCALCVLWCGNGFGDARDDRYNEGGRNFLTHTHNGGNDRVRLKADRGLISTRMGLIKAVAAEDDSEGGTTNALLEEKTAAGGISAGSGGNAAPVPKEVEGAAGAGTPPSPSGPGVPGTGAETRRLPAAGQEGNEKNNLDPKKKAATDSKDQTNDELSSPSGSTPTRSGEKPSLTGTDDINQLPKGKVTELGVERQDNRESDEAIEKEDGAKDKEKKQEKSKLQPEKHEGQNNAGEKPPSLPAPPPPPPPPTTPSGGPAPSISEGEGSPPTELKNSQNPKKVTNEATPSESKTDSEATQPPSGVATQGRHSHDTDTEDSTNNAATGSPAETTTTSSTSTSGSGDHVQNKEDKDDAQISEEQHDSLETGNTNGVPTLSEAEPQTPATVTAAQTNNTAMPVDSDSSTAASHTTFPLLLLLVFACAAAAAVVTA
ncbi:Mucin-associated surface protein (MASP), subgroup S074 [Trypanosoma cruzi]|nr:Mucin-associated surface protein (MASP), subgroup S074 [Trypanosoma cruzi]